MRVAAPHHGCGRTSSTRRSGSANSRRTRTARRASSSCCRDNATTWRTRARAVTAATQVGEGDSELLVTQPLLVRPALPRFPARRRRRDAADPRAQRDGRRTRRDRQHRGRGPDPRRRPRALRPHRARRLGGVRVARPRARRRHGHRALPGRRHRRPCRRRRGQPARPPRRHTGDHRYGRRGRAGAGRGSGVPAGLRDHGQRLAGGLAAGIAGRRARRGAQALQAVPV